MKYFCSKCGKTTQYNFELPKFCAFCGQCFANKPASLETDTKRSKFLNELKLKKNINDNYDNDLEEVAGTQEQNINFKSIKAKYQLNVYNNKGESFGSLIDNPSAPTEKMGNENNNNQRTSEQILADFKKEASSVRNKE
jgi:hypothetical protein